MGKFIIKWYGLPYDNNVEGLYAEMLYESKGIIVQFVAGDVLEPEESAYWNAYNKTSEEYISKNSAVTF